MTIAGRWINDTESEAVCHLLERPVGIGGLTAAEMNAMAALTRKGLAEFRGGAYRPTLLLMTAMRDAYRCLEVA
ncbi:MAG TPA: hypothetical protein VFV05_00965 [Methylomirabilota bacterium]|nr:hypothetical protein [Methylomirabilota bacterium]